MAPFAQVIAALGLLGVVLGAGPTATQGPVIAVRIELDAPVGCADPQAFSDALSERSPNIRFAKPGEPATLLRIRLARTGNQVRGELSIDADGATDTRRVEGASCEDVMRGLSLTAALALDRLLPAHADASSTPDAHGGAGDGTDTAGGKPSSTPPAADTNKPPPVEQPAKRSNETEPKSVPKARETFRVGLGLELATAELVSPKWSSGGGATFAVQRGREGPSLALALVYLSNDAFGHSPDLTTRWLGALVSACPARFTLTGPTWIEGCGLLSGGRLSVSDREALRGRSVARSWWSAGALVRGGLDFSRGVSGQLELGLSIPLLERRFVLENPEQSVGRSPAASPFLGVGVRYQL